MTAPALTSDAPSIRARVAPRGLAALVSEIADLKRVRAAHLSDSWAAVRFAAAWQAILHDRPLETVAMEETARAVAAARLGAIHPSQLVDGGLSSEQIVAIFRAAITEQSDGVAPRLMRPLLDAIEDVIEEELRRKPTGDVEDVPWFVNALARQPRAGATCPGRARILLDPPESHAEHCYTVAVCGVLASGVEDSQVSPERAFLFGLAHHLHNATLADSGFAGEVFLGDQLDAVLDALFEKAYRSLPSSLAETIRQMRTEFAGIDTADARSFHRADVLDRVAEMRHFETAATFTAQTALHDLDLVHVGPTQSFGQQVLREAGWWDG